VKSSKLDKWTKEWIDIVEHVGNKLANDFYEFKIPTDQSKPDMNSSDEARRK
jgi:hypothetical protein